MRYEGPRSSGKPIIDFILAKLNFVLLLIIAFCFNYMLVNFLFQ